ncbi:uncharacterized protein LOC126474375 [Schistocerca serialis cubense]|uniref:uncharacterized protein LOC126474375 n=1 Tax=Schistocerca serialis cubense TaxID=2023355 RepID=UPI00214E4F85|nr:uncharacterized protein LOC126474375 [Schistocerca serialis cubense]
MSKFFVSPHPTSVLVAVKMLKEILVMFCIPFIVTGTEEGACECAAFLSKDSVEETPLTVHSTRFKASCDATGSLTCKNLCLFLTLQAGNTTSTVLCQSLKSDPIRATLESVKLQKPDLKNY